MSYLFYAVFPVYLNACKQNYISSSEIKFETIYLLLVVSNMAVWHIQSSVNQGVHDFLFVSILHSVDA